MRYKDLEDVGFTLLMRYVLKTLWNALFSVRMHVRAPERHTDSQTLCRRRRADLSV